MLYTGPTQLDARNPIWSPKQSKGQRDTMARRSCVWTTLSTARRDPSKEPGINPSTARGRYPTPLAWTRPRFNPEWHMVLEASQGVSRRRVGGEPQYHRA